MSNLPCEAPCAACGSVLTSLEQDGFINIKGKLYREIVIDHAKSQQDRIAELEAELKARDSELADLTQVVEEGIANTCTALDLSAEYYDRDQAAIACYMDFFKETSALFSRFNIKYDHSDAWDFYQSSPPEKDNAK